MAWTPRSLQVVFVVLVYLGGLAVDDSPGAASDSQSSPFGGQRGAVGVEIPTAATGHMIGGPDAIRSIIRDANISYSS